MIVKRRTRAVGLGLWLGAGLLLAQSVHAQEVVRISYVQPPGFMVPLVFRLDDSVLKHKGKTYTVDLIKMRGTPQSLTAMAAGEVDIAGLSYSAFAAGVVNARQDIRAICDGARDGVNWSAPFVVLDSSPIRKITDLKGKILSISSKGSGFDMNARAALIKHGLKPEVDVTLVEAAIPAQEAMLRQGKVDAAIMVAPFWERAHAKGGVRVLFRQNEAQGVIQQLLYAARSDYIAKHRAVIVDVLEDYVRGTNWFFDPANREKALDIIAAATKRPRPAFVSWAFKIGRDLDHSRDGSLDTHALQNNIDLMAKLGFLKHSFDVEKYVDQSMVREAAARIK